MTKEDYGWYKDFTDSLSNDIIKKDEQITYYKRALESTMKGFTEKIKALEAIIVEQEEEIASRKRSCALEIAHSRQLEEKIKELESRLFEYKEVKLK